MPELLLELGCEELPASFVRKAYEDLQAGITQRLKEAGIPFSECQSLGTPRRLIVQVRDLAERQPDVQKEQRGPALAAAYDASGNPTKALEGFCRGQGIDLSAVRKEGDYVWVTKTIPGKPTAEVLSELLPESIRSLNFGKGMRWGTHRLRFARPIRWILACYGGSVVPFEIDGIHSGNESRGHRFNHPEAFQAATFDEILVKLRQRQVEADPARREQTIREATLNVATGKPDLTDALVDENVFLTEWPRAVEGSFLDAYLELPAPVLVTAMAKHEKFFPVRNEEGRLTNRFISIANGGVDDVVREGNAWVLNARFNDAKFFFDEDRKHSLEDFLEKTKGIVYQDKLGTIHQRAYRLAELAMEVAKATFASEEEIEFARQTGLFAKADLSTGLVSELPELQGVIGSEYARREERPDPVCWAIRSQYDLGLNPMIDCEGARTAVRLVIADQLDKLVGYLGIEQVPSGSSDPYGLRRAAILLIEAALRWPARFRGYRQLLEPARQSYLEQGVELKPVEQLLAEIFGSRYEAVFGDARHDLVEAAQLHDYVGNLEELDPQGVRFRLKVLEQLSDDIAFIQTATRPQNIVAAAVNKGIGFAFQDPLADLERLDSAEGERLADVARQISPAVAKAVESEDAEDLIREVKRLEQPINAFFDSTMVMVEDDAVRGARLSLLHGVHMLLREGGDFSAVVIAG